jgi:small-conductance mechanosensitive channel
MIPDWAKGSPGWEALFGLIILGVSLFIALSLHPLLTRFVRMLTQKTKTKLDDFLLEAISRPLFVFVLVQGVFLALSTTTFLEAGQLWINRVWVVLAGFVGMWGVQRVIGALTRWYSMEVAARTQSNMDDKLMPLVRRFLVTMVYAIGLLLLLDNLGIRLSPLLAGLGIGGLAVALALQPTLSNLIASAYMVADGVISVGDFIELQGGPSGTVLDVGWRSTKIRTQLNNLVVIPNSKLADSIVTNYMAPDNQVGIWVTCGVSYESDLQKVEDVALEVARSVVQDLPDNVVVKEFQPVVYFREFADSNINFIVAMRAKDRPGTFAVLHHLIKRLHAKFAKEGIEINYPVRKLVFPQSNGSTAGATAIQTSEVNTTVRSRGLSKESDGGGRGPVASLVSAAL